MFFRKFLTILLAVTSCLLFNTRTCSANPGLRVKVTKNGFNYANEIVMKKLYQMMLTYKIPDVQNQGSSYTEFTNMKTDSISKPNGKIVLLPGHGLKWIVNMDLLKISGNWKYSKKIWFFTIRKSGSFQVTSHNSQIEITTSLTKAPNGGLSIKATDCNSNLKLEASFKSWIVNIVFYIFKGKITRILKSKICSSVVSIVNNNAAKVISNYPVTYPFAKNYVFDYSLESNPVIDSNYLQTNHKAIISYKNDKRIIPFTAKPLPNISENNKMVYFIISNYVLDTMLFSAHENNVFKYTVNSENLPDGSSEFFRTTCPDSFCMGTILPQFSRNFTNGMIEIYFSTFDRPRAYFYPDTIRISVPTQLRFSVLQPNMKKTEVITVYLNVSAEVKAQFKDNNIYFSIANITFRFGKLSGPYADYFDVATVEKGLQTVFKELTPFINSIGSTAIPVILPKKTSFVNPEVRIVNNAIIASTDLKIGLI